MSPAGGGADNPEQQEATNYRQVFLSPHLTNAGSPPALLVERTKRAADLAGRG